MQPHTSSAAPAGSTSLTVQHTCTSTAVGDSKDRGRTPAGPLSGPGISLLTRIPPPPLTASTSTSTPQSALREFNSQRTPAGCPTATLSKPCRMPTGLSTPRGSQTRQMPAAATLRGTSTPREHAAGLSSIPTPRSGASGLTTPRGSASARPPQPPSSSGGITTPRRRGSGQATAPGGGCYTPRSGAPGTPRGRKKMKKQQPQQGGAAAAGASTRLEVICSASLEELEEALAAATEEIRAADDQLAVELLRNAELVSALANKRVEAAALAKKRADCADLAAKLRQEQQAYQSLAVQQQQLQAQLQEQACTQTSLEQQLQENAVLQERVRALEAQVNTGLQAQLLAAAQAGSVLHQRLAALQDGNTALHRLHQGQQRGAADLQHHIQHAEVHKALLEARLQEAAAHAGTQSAAYQDLQQQVAQLVQSAMSKLALPPQLAPQPPPQAAPAEAGRQAGAGATHADEASVSQAACDVPPGAEEPSSSAAQAATSRAVPRLKLAPVSTRPDVQNGVEPEPGAMEQVLQVGIDGESPPSVRLRALSWELAVSKSAASTPRLSTAAEPAAAASLAQPTSRQTTSLVENHAEGVAAQQLGSAEPSGRRAVPAVPKLQLPREAAGGLSSTSPMMQRILSMREKFAEAELLLTPRTRAVGQTGFGA